MNFYLRLETSGKAQTRRVLELDPTANMVPEGWKATVRIAWGSSRRQIGTNLGRDIFWSSSWQTDWNTCVSHYSLPSNVYSFMNLLNKISIILCLTEKESKPNRILHQSGWRVWASFWGSEILLVQLVWFRLPQQQRAYCLLNYFKCRMRRWNRIQLIFSSSFNFFSLKINFINNHLNIYYL